MILIKFLLLGFFTALLFPPFFILPLGFIIFPYLYKQMQKLNHSNSLLLNFFSGFLYGFGFLIIYLIWIKNPFLIVEPAKQFSFLAYLLILLLSIFFGIFFILFKFTRYFLSQIYLIPLHFIVLEIFIANFGYGFPWISFSLIISNLSVGSYLIYLFGTHFTGFLVIFIFLVPLLFIEIKKYSKIGRKFFASILLIFIFIISGYLIKFKLSNNLEFNSVEVDLFQMNYSVSKNKKLDANFKYNEIVNLVKNSKADLIIFAENNFPYLIKDINEIKIGNLLKDNQIMIIGATRKENEDYYNSLLAIEKNNINFFDKKILVPFGEFIPFRNYLGFMDIIAGLVDFKIGSKDRLIKINDQYTFVPVICYEIIFFWKLINKKNNYADFIVNITNDSWFGNLIGPYQHLYLTKMRAAEFNKPLIRVSNNGISAIFDKNGKIITSTQLNTKTKKNLSIKIINGYSLILFHKILNILIILFFICHFYFVIIRNK